MKTNTENQNRKAITWQQLKDFCNSLSDENLKKAVQWSGEERGGLIDSAELLTEDYVDTDYGAMSMTDYMQGDPEDIEEDPTIVWHKDCRYCGSI